MNLGSPFTGECFVGASWSRDLTCRYFALAVAFTIPSHPCPPSDEEYTGLLCGECIPLHFRDKLTGTCKPCEGQVISPLMVWLIILITVAALAYPAWLFHKWLKAKGYIGGEGGDNIMVDNCTTVFFVSATANSHPPHTSPPVTNSPATVKFYLTTLSTPDPADRDPDEQPQQDARWKKWLRTALRPRVSFC